MACPDVITRFFRGQIARRIKVITKGPPQSKGKHCKSEGLHSTTRGAPVRPYQGSEAREEGAHLLCGKCMRPGRGQSAEQVLGARECASQEESSDVAVWGCRGGEGQSTLLGKDGYIFSTFAGGRSCSKGQHAFYLCMCQR